MNQQSDMTPTLFKLLAREWNVDAAITSMLFNRRQSAVAYALDNGTVAIAGVSDEDPPEQRIHISAENGRSTIRPRASEPEPLKVIETEPGGANLLGALGEEDFVVLGADRQITTVSPGGEAAPLRLEVPGPVTAFGHCPASEAFACVSGTQVCVFDDSAETPITRFDHGEPIAALGFSPDGHSIAIAHDYGLTVWTLGSGGQKAKDIAFPGQPRAVYWKPDGGWIAAPLGDGGFQLTCMRDGRTRALTDYPAPVGSIAWNGAANALITSGAFRIAAWSMDNPPIEDASKGALETGRAGLVPVSAVTSHPDRNLVAAGYDNGLVTIVQLGGRDELVLKGDDQGAVTHLAWSGTGRHIAIGTGNGSAAIASLPPQMFK